MSSLRVESLRLCWLEAFIAVADRENISDAARSLAIDQSSVSRYMQALETWLGEALIEPGKVVDLQDARVSIGITDYGREFYIVAERVVKELFEIRNENAVGSELLRQMEKIVLIMEKDMETIPPLSVTSLIIKNISKFREIISSINNDHSIELLRSLHENMQGFYQRYEREKKKEKRVSRGKSKNLGSNINGTLLL